jgi:hypothetical protein
MEDAITDLGRRIVEVSRLAVAMHLESGRSTLSAEPDMLRHWRRQVKSALNSIHLNGNERRLAQGRVQ